MSEDTKYVRIYTGPETNVQYLQELLGDENINTRVRNDFESGRLAGFGATPDMVLLFVPENQAEAAFKIAKETFPKDFENE